MAASLNAVRWRDQLNEAFKKSRICFGEQERTTQGSLSPVDSRNIICTYGSDLYVWNSAECCIVYCNLKQFNRSFRGHGHDHLRQSEYNIKQEVDHDLDQDLDLVNPDQPKEEGGKFMQHMPASQSDPKNDDDQDTHFQKLFLTGGFTVDIENISINTNGTLLLVWSSYGIRVVELPQRWGKNALYEGGKEVISCRTTCVGERNFASSKSLRVRQASWHPGSKTNSHLAVLTSDNKFCVYTIQDADQPLSTIDISSGDVSSHYSPSKSFVSAALGETAVAFDFGLPVSLEPKLRTLQGASMTAPLELWPVYCVCGNGDVMILYSHISHARPLQLPVQGPITMYPPAESNYGVDACSILCLPTPVPVIVISTCEGKLHHCIQLPSSSEDDTLQSEPGPISPTSSISELCLYKTLPTPGLYVIESAELELCINVPMFEEQAVVEDDFTCPIKLKKDPCSPDRYHCSHAAGVHSVALPWLQLVQQFFLYQQGDLELQEEKECVVEHLVCTKPLSSCPLSPILGLDVVTDSTLGPTLLILSSAYEFTALNIGLQYRIGKMYDIMQHDSGDLSESPVQRHVREPFSDQIAQILKRKTSVPILKSSSTTVLSQQDCFQLLSRTTQVLREEYIERQDHARQEISKRTAILRQHKEHQLQDLKRLTDSKLMLLSHARIIAENLEASKENHERLLKRLEAVLHQLQQRAPMLTEAERLMMKELNKVKDTMHVCSQSISQLRAKQDYQSRQAVKPGSSSGPTFQEKQLAQIHSILQEEGEDILELKKDLSRLTLEIS